VLQDAFETDVRDALAEYRGERGAAERPVEEYLAGDERAARREQREI
jgi:L-rhamnose isomerase